jgi:hypothetical protein
MKAKEPRSGFGLNELLGRQCASDTRLPATVRLNRSQDNRAHPRNHQPELAEATCLGRKTDRQVPGIAKAEERQAAGTMTHSMRWPKNKDVERSQERHIAADTATGCFSAA